MITKRGDYALSYLDCGCGRRSEQRMQTESRTLLECVSSLGELVEKKHATCIADRVAELETASAAAAHRESLGCLGTMMAAATARATSERREAELLAAQELVKKTKVAAATAEKHARAARRAEVEAAAPFLALRKAAESEAATLAAAAATARSALAELQGDAKRARVEEADDDPPPLTDELPCQWGLGTFRTQEQWTAKRRAKPITEGAKQVTLQRGLATRATWSTRGAGSSALCRRRQRAQAF